MTSKLWQEMNVEEKEEYNLKADALLLHKLITPAVSAALTDTAPEIEVPSISSSAMMVELSISQWLGKKKDRKASKKVTDDNNAETGVANVHKKLLGGCVELEAVHDLTGNIRNEHYRLTMPWLDTGVRLLPTKAYFDYHKMMTEHEQNWHNKVSTFLAAYDWEISQAEARLGDLFNRAEYPTADQLSGKFSFSINYIPMPESGDFRLDIGNQGNTQLADHYQTFYADRIENSYKEVWTRVYTALSKMSERLDYTGKEDKKTFRDSLVENVLEITPLLDTFNVTGSSQMSEMKRKLEETMHGITPEALRDDDHLRRETKRNVDDIIKSLPSLDV
mgnify:CR=1 FL=1